MMNFIYGVLATLYFAFNIYAMIEEAKNYEKDEKLKKYSRLTFILFFGTSELIFYILTHLMNYIIPVEFIKMSFLKTFWRSRYEKMYNTDMMRDFIGRMAQRARTEKPWYYVPRYNWILGDKLLKGERILFARIKSFLDIVSDLSNWDGYMRFFYGFNTYILLILINHWTFRLPVVLMLLLSMVSMYFFRKLNEKEKYNKIFEKYTLDGIYRVAISRYVRYLYYWVTVVLFVLLSYIVFDCITDFDYSKYLSESDTLTNIIIILINTFPLVFEVIRQVRRKSKGLPFRVIPLLIMIIYVVLFNLATL